MIKKNILEKVKKQNQLAATVSSLSADTPVDASATSFQLLGRIQELHSQLWQQTAARLTAMVEAQEPSSLGDSFKTARSFHLLSFSSSRSASCHLLPIIHLIKTMPKGF